MDKPVLAREYLTLIRFLVFGYVLWGVYVGFQTAMLAVKTQVTLDSLLLALAVPFGVKGGYAPELAWIVIVAPYALWALFRSVRWAIKNQK